MIDELELELLLDDAVDRGKARTSFAAYAQWDYPEYVKGRHLEVMTAALEDVEAGRCDRLIITMPPRHSKTFHVSERFPAWYLGKNPDHAVIGAAHTSGLAEDFSYTVRELIQDQNYPFGLEIRDNRGKVQEWKIAGHRGRYLAVGVGGSPVGKGGDLIIIDDPIKNHADAASQRNRDNLWKWYQSVIYGRRQPGAKIIVVATRWHEDDLIGRLLQAERNGADTWRVIHFPAVATSPNDTLGRTPGDILWPEFWSEQEYAATRKAVGSEVWESQYQGNPVSQVGGVVKRSWIRYWQFKGMNLPPVEVEDQAGNVIAAHPVMELPTWFDAQIQSWDMTFKQTNAGSYVVGLELGITNAMTYVLGLYRERADFPTSVRAVQRMQAQFPRTTIKLVEAKANGPAVIDTLRPHMPGMVPIESTDLDKAARYSAASWYVEGGNYVIPHPLIASWVHAYVNELVSFPRSPNNDQVDATSQAIDYITHNLINTEGMHDVIGDIMQGMRGIV